MERIPSYTDSERVWLVKSSTKIVGPFSILEISEFLGKRQISIIDEIRGPFSRWVFLREHASFAEIIKSVRHQQENSREDTLTAATTSTGSGGKTTTSTVSVSEELTPTPSFRAGQLPSANSIKDVQTSSQNLDSSRNDSKFYANGLASTSRAKSDSERKNNLWISLGLVVVIAGFAVFYKHNKDQRKFTSAEHYYQSAIRQKNLGLFDKAVESYKLGLALQAPDRETKLQILPILLTTDGQTSELRKEFELQLQQKDLNKYDQAELDTYIGLSYLIDRDFEQSAKYFRLALDLAPGNLAATFNLASLALQKRNKEEFKTYINNMQLGRESAFMSSLLKAKMIILDKTDETDVEIGEILKILQTQIMQNSSFRREISFISYVLAKGIHDSGRASFFASVFLESAHRTSREFSRDLKYDSSIFDWDWLSSSCSALSASSTPTDQMVFSVCAQLTGLQSQGLKVVNELVASGQKGREIILAQAQTLLIGSRIREAQVVLKSFDSNDDIPVTLLLGDACLKSDDLSCAQEAFARVNLKSPQNVEALEGMGRVAFKLREEKLARDYVRQALLIEPNFLPAVDLRDTLESKR